MFKRAETYAEKGQIASALEEYKRLLSLYPDNYDIHLNSGELYEKINEISRAKLEYIMAIRTGQKYRPEAYLKLAKIYCTEKRYNIAEDIIDDIKDTRNYKALEELGDIYYSWGIYLKNIDKPAAIRKLKEAREYYKRANSKLNKDTLQNIIDLYAYIADELIISKQVKKAIKILELSIDYEDNSLAHYKLAKIYEEKGNEDKAIKEYSQAFGLDSEIADTNPYTALLIKKAQEFKEAGDNVTSEYYYKKAKKLDSRIDIPENPDKRILFTLIATRVNEDIDNDIIVPGITFKLINISQNVIDNLRVKIVFLKEDKPVSSQLITIADKENPLDGDSESSEIKVFSTFPIKHVFDDHDLKVQVYISQYTPDKWRLFRNIEITRERAPVRLVE